MFYSAEDAVGVGTSFVLIAFLCKAGADSDNPANRFDGIHER